MKTCQVCDKIQQSLADAYCLHERLRNQRRLSELLGNTAGIDEADKSLAVCHENKELLKAQRDEHERCDHAEEMAHGGSL